MSVRIEVARWPGDYVLVRDCDPHWLGPIEFTMVAPEGKVLEVAVSFSGRDIISGTCYHWGRADTQREADRKLCWFMNATLPQGTLASIPAVSADALGAPRAVPQSVAAVVDPDGEVERSSLELHELLASRGDLDGLALQIVEKMTGSAARRVVNWPIRGLMLVSGVVDDASSAILTRRMRSWLSSNEFASWSLSDPDSRIVGLGRTPGEAIRSAGYLVLPGEEDSWKEERQSTGELLLEADLYLLLDEIPPFWRQPFDPDASE